MKKIYNLFLFGRERVCVQRPIAFENSQSSETFFGSLTDVRREQNGSHIVFEFSVRGAPIRHAMASSTSVCAIALLPCFHPAC